MQGSRVRVFQKMASTKAICSIGGKPWITDLQLSSCRPVIMNPVSLIWICVLPNIYPSLDPAFTDSNAFPDLTHILTYTLNVTLLGIHLNPLLIIISDTLTHDPDPDYDPQHYSNPDFQWDLHFENFISISSLSLTLTVFLVLALPLTIIFIQMLVTLTVNLKDI